MLLFDKRDDIENEDDFAVSKACSKELLYRKGWLILEEHIQDLIDAAHEGVIILSEELKAFIIDVLSNWFGVNEQGVVDYWKVDTRVTFQSPKIRFS